MYYNRQHRENYATIQQEVYGLIIYDYKTFKISSWNNIFMWKIHRHIKSWEKIFSKYGKRQITLIDKSKIYILP